MRLWIVILLAVVVVSGCTGVSEPQEKQDTDRGGIDLPVGEGSYEVEEINITSKGLEPSSPAVKSGAAVRWRNQLEENATLRFIEVGKRFELRPGEHHSMFFISSTTYDVYSGGEELGEGRISVTR